MALLPGFAAAISDNRINRATVGTTRTRSAVRVLSAEVAK